MAGYPQRSVVHRTYIGGIERGEHNPTITSLYRFARSLGLQPSEIIQDG